MKNLTLALEEDILLAARKLALDRNTTVNKLVREYLRNFVEEQSRRKAALARLSKMMDSGILEVGPRTWSREDLHER